MSRKGGNQKTLRTVGGGGRGVRGEGIRRCAAQRVKILGVCGAALARRLMYALARKLDLC